MLERWKEDVVEVDGEQVEHALLADGAGSESRVVRLRKRVRAVSQRPVADKIKNAFVGHSLAATEAEVFQCVRDTRVVENLSHDRGPSLNQRTWRAGPHDSKSSPLALPLDDADIGIDIDICDLDEVARARRDAVGFARTGTGAARGAVQSIDREDSHLVSAERRDKKSSTGQTPLGTTLLRGFLNDFCNAVPCAVQSQLPEFLEDNVRICVLQWSQHRA